MKHVFLILCSLFFLVPTVEAQKAYKQKKKKKDFFGGARDYRDYTPWGIQAQIGATYTFTPSKNDWQNSPDSANNRFRYLQDPAGKAGVFVEIGFARFNMKAAKFKFGRFVDYLDFGVGYKLIGGKETTKVENLDAVDNVVSSAEGKGDFYNGYLFGRFAVHKLIYLNKEKNYFFDNSLGINGDYRVSGRNQNYSGVFFPSTQQFSGDFRLQLHYGLGFGIRLKRGTYLIPGVQLPILGIQEWNKGRTGLDWYSSRYYPVLFHLKIIQLFVKKSNGCNTGSDADKKRNEEFLQGQ